MTSVPDLAPSLSIVAPCYNEERSLKEFVGRMTSACETVTDDYEIILVNDGSRDGTWGTMQQLVKDWPKVIGVNLARNHGHQLAVSAGLSLARGARVLILDADLQDPPELLAKMFELMEQGYDVVYGQRETRAKETLFKLMTARWFYRILSTLSEVSIPRDVGDFRLMSRRTVDRLLAMPERDRFIRGMVAWLGGRQIAIRYDRDPRFAGQTNYGFGKMLRLAVDGIVSFSTAPLRIASLLALTGTFLGLLICAYTLLGFLFGDVNRGWTSQALITTFFGVGQLACLSVIGAYLGRMYSQVKGSTVPHR